MEFTIKVDIDSDQWHETVDDVLNSDAVEEFLKGLVILEDAGFEVADVERVFEDPLEAARLKGQMVAQEFLEAAKA